MFTSLSRQMEINELLEGPPPLEIEWEQDKDSSQKKNYLSGASTLKKYANFARPPPPQPVACTLFTPCVGNPRKKSSRNIPMLRRTSTFSKKDQEALFKKLGAAAGGPKPTRVSAFGKEAAQVPSSGDDSGKSQVRPVAAPATKEEEDELKLDLKGVVRAGGKKSRNCGSFNNARKLQKSSTITMADTLPANPSKPSLRSSLFHSHVHQNQTEKVHEGDSGVFARASAVAAKDIAGTYKSGHIKLRRTTHGRGSTTQLPDLGPQFRSHRTHVGDETRLPKVPKPADILGILGSIQQDIALASYKTMI